MSNPSPSPSRWQAPLLLAIAIFGPPTAFLTFAHALTQNPVLITLLIVFYETGLTLAALFGKVWQKLVDPWLEQIASWIRTRVQWLVSHPHKTYCQYMFHDVKGLDMQTTFNLALDQVFVELSMVPTLPDQTSANPLQLPKSLSGGSHPIWDYLSAPVLREQHLVLIGPPGSGKSTLLKHTALALIGHKHHRASKDSKLPHRLPVLLFLREYADSIGQNADFSLENAVSAHCKMRWKQTLPPAWMRYHLMKGDCLVLLDGLDEVADAATRKQVVDWVRDQIDAYPKNRFVVTSRPHGFKSYPLTGVTVLEVRPFTPKQIEQFVHNWYTANEIMSAQKDDPDVRLKATNRAEDLLGRLRNAPALYDLAINPLLLTMIMIATAHRYRDTLPGKRVTLYAEICEVFLGKRQEAKGLALELTAAQKRQVLQPLAYFMMEKGIREIAQNEACKAIQPSLAQVSSQMTPEEFLQMVENTSGLFLERDPEIYSFAHLTFQEYLAAVYLKEEGREALLVAHVADTWWHETIRLYCAQADVSAIITACLSRGRLSVPTLTLAIECYQEKLRIQPAVEQQYNMLLTQGAEHPNLDLRRLVAEALLMKRLQQMAHLRENVYVDRSLVTCAEYQLFLDEQRVQGKFHQPDHWEDPSFPPSLGNEPVLGMRYSDAVAFCDWLTQRDSGLWLYRLPKEDELKELEANNDISITVAVDTGCWAEGQTVKINRIPYVSDSTKGCIQEVLNLDLACARNLDLDRDLNFARDRALALVRALDPDLDLDLDRALARVRDLDLSLALNLDRALALDHTLDYTFTHHLVRDLARARVLARALEHDRDRLMKGKVQKQQVTVLRRYIRFFTYTLAHYLRYISQKEKSSRNLGMRLRSLLSQESDSFEQAIETCLDICVTFALLELRIQGKLPAWEGILLVRERRVGE